MSSTKQRSGNIGPSNVPQTYYYISPSNDPFYNIALEDYLYSCRLDCTHIYMLWVNRPSVFMGRYQTARAETDWDYLSQQGIPILRRLSGGGTVYHDTGNLNFTCIQTDPTGRGFDLAAFPEPVIRAMSRQGVTLTRSPRGDLRLDGLKVGGCAETMRRGRMLYHLSLLFDADLYELERVLSVPAGELVQSRVPSVRSQVANLRSVLPQTNTIEQFRGLILDELHQIYPNIQPLVLNPIEAEKYIQRMRREKFETEEWIHSSIGMR